MTHIRPLVKYHGGKGRLYRWILGHFPDTYATYVEPFGGAASVLLNKPRSVEVYNELEPQMFNLMRTIQTEYPAFIAGVSAVEYNKPTFLEHLKLLQANEFKSDLERAVVFYIVKRMSRGGLCERFSWSDRIYSTGPAEVHCWNTALDNMQHVHDRLQGVTLVNRNAFDLLPEYVNDPNCFIYLDPPYLTSTRVYKKAYDHEFTDADHKRLADLIVPAKAKIMLSGYDSPEYDEWFGHWTRHVKDVANHSSKHNGKLKVRKYEVLWTNYSRSM